MFDLQQATTVAEIFSAEYFLVLCVLSLANVCFLLIVSRKFMQIIQQSGYTLSGYHKWTSRRGNIYITRLYMISMLAVLAYLVFSIAFSFANASVIMLISFIPYCIFLLLYIRGDRKRKSKCPLIFTPRIIRLFITYAILMFGLTLIFFVGTALLGLLISTNDILYRVRFCLVCLTPICVPCIVGLANAINKPIENLNNAKYIDRCKKKLAEQKDLIKIGITGSYGKTTVKEILKTILSEKYSVLATPASYNTPMGICKTVKNLNSSYDIFIAEMGARHEGDIRELCDIVRPNFGIINGIVEHHMETFSSLNQIKNTKFELVNGVEKGGKVIITCDNENTFSMKENCKGNILVAGLDLSKNPNVYATNVEVGTFGSKFTLHIGEKQVDCITALLGAHNISNILLCACLCNELNMSIDQISAGIARIKPINHRLEVSISDSGVIILDDSYNSNVNGTKAALEVFSKFDGKKIIITPGMVELGKYEDRENFELGKRLATVIDFAVLVGSYGAYKIRDGLLESGFSLDNIYMAKDLDAASSYLKKIVKPKDVVLFENDLPDKFS